jgi:hypothetical protein
VDGLILCLGLSGVLSLFCQNKLGVVSPCGWMLQNGHFADGPDPMGSHVMVIFKL